MPDYEVYMTTTSSYSQTIQADSEEEAIELAQEIENWVLLDETGGKYRVCGFN